MNDEKHPLLLELCHIAHQRNLIESRRNKARGRKGHYVLMKTVTEAWAPNDKELESLESSLLYTTDYDCVKELRQKIQNRKATIKWLRNSNPKSTKWIGRMHELNMMILKNEMQYVKAKYDAARHTSRTHKRVLKLIKELDVRLNYCNGSIVSIYEPLNYFEDNELFINQVDIAKYAKEYEAQKAVENMLKGKYDKKD